MQQWLYALAAPSSTSYLVCYTWQRLLTTMFVWGARADYAFWKCFLQSWSGSSFLPLPNPSHNVYSDTSGTYGCGAVVDILGFFNCSARGVVESTLRFYVVRKKHYLTFRSQFNCRPLPVTESTLLRFTVHLASTIRSLIPNNSSVLVCCTLPSNC